MAPPASGAAAPSAPDPAETPAPSIVAPEPQGRVVYQVYDFRTDQWAEHYGKRIDATIAALKSANVPVFWVGLPSIRGPRSTSDMQYLDDLYRERVEKAGLSYIDVWDGFVDDAGRYTPQGPDFEGQIRRLRAGDGVHFTKAGARKLAHYVERELRRMMTRGVTTVALPTSEPTQAPRATAGPAEPAAAVRSGAAADGGDQRPAGSRRQRRALRAGRPADRDPGAGQGRGDPGAGRAQRRLRLAAARHRAVRHRSGGGDDHRSDPGHAGGAGGDHRAGTERGDPPGRSGRAAPRRAAPAAGATTVGSWGWQQQQQQQQQARRSNSFFGGFGGFWR